MRLMSKISKRTRTWVREYITPGMSFIYRKLGMVDRQQLLQNLTAQFKNADNQGALIDRLALAGILKWRYYLSADEKPSNVDNIAECMISGRVSKQRIAGFAASQTEDAAQIETIRDNLLGNDVINKYVSWAIHYPVNLAGRLAFLGGAAAAVYAALSLFGAHMFWALPAYTIISRALVNKSLSPIIKESRFNPRSNLGLTLRLGDILFWPIMLTSTISGFLLVYTDAFEYKGYENQRNITAAREEKLVELKVCDEQGKDCETNPLWLYTGPDAAKRAGQTVKEIQAVIDNNLLFCSFCMIETEEGTIEIHDPLRPALTPDFFPGGRHIILDLSPQKGNLSDKEWDKKRGAAFISFYNNLWASGAMPTATELAKARIELLEGWLPWRLFRDVRLKTKLELASLYSQAKEYEKAEALFKEIIEFDLSVTTNKPMFTDEAYFGLYDSNLSRAMRFWSPERLSIAMDHLIEGHDNLMAEPGYRVRYNFKMLQVCSIGRQFFPKVRDARYLKHCQPDDIERYQQNATFGLNLMTPGHLDNFIAVRTFLEAGGLKLTEKKDFEGAREEFEKALALLDMIDDCSVIITPGAEKKFQLYRPYMRPLDLAIAEREGQAAALDSFFARCELGRALRFDHGLNFRVGPWEIDRPKQWNPKYFKVFRAKTRQGLAGIEIKYAEIRLRFNQQEEKEKAIQHLLRANDELDTAYDIVKKIQSDNGLKFFTEMFEEQEAYYEVLIDRAEVWHDLYLYKAFHDKAIDLELIEELAREVKSQRGEEPLDIIYLRSLYLIGTIASRYAERKVEAARLFTEILTDIEKGEEQLPGGVDLPPQYKILKEKARNNVIILNRR